MTDENGSTVVQDSTAFVTIIDASGAIVILPPGASDATSLTKEIIVRATIGNSSQIASVKGANTGKGSQIFVSTGSAPIAGIILVLVVAVTVVFYFYYRKKR